MAKQPGAGTTLASFEIDVWRGQRNEHFLAIMRAGFWRPYTCALTFYAAILTTMALAGQPAWRVAAVAAVAIAHSCGQMAILRWTTTSRNVEQAVVLANSTILVMLAALVVL